MDSIMIGGYTISQIISITVPILLLALVLTILTKPIKFIFKLLINTGLGFVCLFVLNMLSGSTGIVFETNVITASIVGILGIPGVIILLIFHFVM